MSDSFRRFSPVGWFKLPASELVNGFRKGEAVNDHRAKTTTRDLLHLLS